ncbi:MDR family MFS transporter [Brachybacterium sp. YJGR34]|uniref:MDR family MFS transporter n=1 Tax=Brachybacterium sp. YJGR34 TaxID=2059911 RepID=UPI000E0C0999|nr:MDR family MFS transporter [Brachybacterium sp. YJGR34]
MPDAAVGTALSSQLSRRRINLIFGTVMLAMLISSLDQTIVSTALPTIVADVGGADHLSWVVSAYLLTQTVTVILAGKFGDLFGRKLILQLSAGVFVGASAACGLSEDMLWLIVWRAVQGIGAGGITVTATALIADVVPLRDRGRYQGALGAVFGVSTVIGPLLGGLFTDHLSWRWAFYINLPLGILVIAVAAATIPRISRTERPPIDYLGIVFIALGASALTLAVSWGGTQYPWASPTIIGLFVGAAVALTIFLVVESRAPAPILPLRLFRFQVFSICVVLSFVVGFAMLGSMTFLPTYMQYVKGISATGSGLHTLPMVAGMLTTSILAGTIVGRTGRYRIFPVLGSLTMAFGLFLLSRMDAGTSTLMMSASLLVLGLGIGLSMQVLTLIVQNTSDYSDLGVATSGVTFFRTLGGSFGTSLMGTVYASSLRDELPQAVTQAGLDPRQIDPNSVSPSVLDQLTDAQRAPIVDAYADALQTVFLAVVPVALLAFVLSLFLKEVPLRDSHRAAATDVGDGFAMAGHEDDQRALQRAVAHHLRVQPPETFAEIRRASRTAMDGASAWCVRQVSIRQRIGADTGLAAIAARVRIPSAVLAPAFAQAVGAGYLRGDASGYQLTSAGQAELDLVETAFREWIGSELSDWGEGDEELDQALDQLARRLVEDEELPVPESAAR